MEEDSDDDHGNGSCRQVARVCPDGRLRREAWALVGDLRSCFGTDLAFLRAPDRKVLIMVACSYGAHKLHDVRASARIDKIVRASTTP